MLKKIGNLIFLRGFRLNRWTRKLLNSMESEFAEEFLQTLLNLMSLMFVINQDYRNNIKDFVGRYQFLSEDGQIREYEMCGAIRASVEYLESSSGAVNLVTSDDDL